MGKHLFRALGPLLALAVLGLPHPLSHLQDGRASGALAMAVWMMAWWLTDAVPMGVTACLPLVWIPALGLLGDTRLEALQAAAAPFADAYLVLFAGGMVLGAAMEESGLHRRVALHIMMRVGTSAPRLLLGVLLATATVSMGLSNTATAVMMLPIAVALLRRLEKDAPGGRLPAWGCSLVLAVAWGANLGGMGTKIGTGTNSIFTGHVAREAGRDVGFVEFMVLAMPLVLALLPLAWGILWRHARRDPVAADAGGGVMAAELAALGPMGSQERRVAWACALAGVLWVLGDVVRPWVAPWVPAPWNGPSYQGKHHEAAVAALCALGVMAAGGVKWRSIRACPWDSLLLLGGSFAMAMALEKTGVSGVAARWMDGAAALSPGARYLLVSGVTVAMTAVASNTATVNLMLAVLPGQLGLQFTAAMASSCDFALPAGTPPNAIVFGSGRIALPVMMRLGLQMDLVAVVLLSLHGAAWVAWRL